MISGGLPGIPRFTGGGRVKRAEGVVGLDGDGGEGRGWRSEDGDGRVVSL